MHQIIILTLLIINVLSAAPNKNQKDIMLKEQELEVLKGLLEASRDSLQSEIASRWRIRQQNFEKRERDKEELSQLREKQERLRNELAQFKEECYSKERSIESENKKVVSKKEEWKFLITNVEDALKKESDLIYEAFPLDIELRQKDLEDIRRKFKTNLNATNAFSDLIDYRMKFLQIGSISSISKKTILPEQGDAQDLTFARFGNMFGYGINSQSEFYIVRQSGNLGSNRYSVEQIGPSALHEYLTNQFPQWIEQQKISGPLMFDIMQNSQTSVLIKGQKINKTDEFIQFVKAGGPVMIPLGILVIWAIVLLFYKLIIFSGKHTADSKISKTVMKHLSNNEIDLALQYVKNHRGVVARVVQTCLEHSKWTRSSAEKAVKEILVEELPQLHKHLTTLSVIAGAAPLLGLLGTVTGMINLFEVITNYGTGDPKILAGGISEALITTEVGLIIAIPVLLIHNFLRNRANDIQASTEKYAIRILNRLWPET